jgi:hypothetical protein
MYFRLAALLGCTVDELLQRASSRELSEWMAYDAVEWLPDRRLEMLTANLLALTANLHRGSDDRAVTALDWMPWMQQDQDDEPEPVDWVRRIEQLNAALGGDDLR